MVRSRMITCPGDGLARLRAEYGAKTNPEVGLAASSRPASILINPADPSSTSAYPLTLRLLARSRPRRAPPPVLL
jgi:hypothetical protein